MRSKLSQSILALGLAGALALPGTPLNAQTWGSGGITLHTLPSGFDIWTDGYAVVNNFGQVAGVSSNQAAIANVGSGTVDLLGTLGGSSSWARGINNAGQVTGTSWTAGDASRHAFLYDGAVMQDRNPSDASVSDGFDVNDVGTLTGTANFSGQLRAFLHSGAASQNLGTIPGGGDSEGKSINGAGQVAGEADASSGFPHAFLYDGSSMNDLGTLGGVRSEAWDINGSGQVAGYSQNSDGLYRAFVHDGGSMQALGTLGGSYGFAYGIDDNGLAIGRAHDASNLYRAAIWESDGLGGYDVYDLNAVLAASGITDWTLTNARSISDDGRFVVAFGENSASQTGYVVLEQAMPASSTVPEPVTLLLLGTGLAGVAGARRRRRTGDA